MVTMITTIIIIVFISCGLAMRPGLWRSDSVEAKAHGWRSVGYGSADPAWFVEACYPCCAPLFPSTTGRVGTTWQTGSTIFDLKALYPKDLCYKICDAIDDATGKTTF